MTTRDDVTAPSHDGGVRAGTHAPVSYPNAAEGRGEAVTVRESFICAALRTEPAGPDGRMGGVVRCRYNAAITVAAAVALLGAVPLATSRWYFAPLLFVPLAVGVWGWRAGTDANANGVRARALFGSRFLPWSRIDSLVVGERNRVYARTTADS